MSTRSQDRAESSKIRRFPVLAALKALTIGMNSRLETCTVVVSHRTDRILSIEDRVHRMARVYVSD